MTYIVPYIRQAAIDYYLKEIRELKSIIDTNKENINYNRYSRIWFYI